MYSSESKEDETPEQSSLDGTGTSYDHLAVPFLVLCDNATQTEMHGEAVCVDAGSAETKTKTSINSDIDYSKPSCDAFVQTEFVNVDVNDMRDLYVQTDDVIIKQLKTSVDCHVQTEVVDDVYNETCVQTD